jgi:hypothetical protein
MYKKINQIAVITLGIDPKSVEIPNELRDFLKLDDQGIYGLDFMISDSNLAKRIPPDVRIQYEKLYTILRLNLEDSLKELRKSIDEIEKNPKDVIYELIDNAIN